MGLPPVPVAVNLLAEQFKRTDLVETVGKLIGEFQTEPSWLELEITESMTMDNVEETVEALHVFARYPRQSNDRRFWSGSLFSGLT